VNNQYLFLEMAQDCRPGLTHPQNQVGGIRTRPGVEYSGGGRGETVVFRSWEFTSCSALSPPPADPDDPERS